MNFFEERIENLSIDTIDDLAKLIICELCGKTFFGAENLLKKDSIKNKSIQLFLDSLKRNGLNWPQFNELLLLLSMKRVSEGFFNYFFRVSNIDMDNVKKGIINFRGMSMLCFGNFRYAYKSLRNKNQQEIEKILTDACSLLVNREEACRERADEIVTIEKICKDDTWLMGYISKRKIEEELQVLESKIDSKRRNDPTDLQFRKLLKVYKSIEERREASLKSGVRNTKTYLTWDYMDVYVATSMRNQWEYSETSEFISKVFSNSKLNSLKLRFFDPTQSFCDSRFDKGLIEGLMLKRALFTLYMAQESDTMGKDSELAATLSQGKLVVAYVPEINIDEYIDRVSLYPICFFKSRYLNLESEEVFLDNDEVFSKIFENYSEMLSDFFLKCDKYISDNPFTLDPDHSKRFIEQESNFNNICRLMANAEKIYFDRRARTLIEFHPLAIQVHLSSGVANGVLVVRSHDQCAKLIYALLSGQLCFKIRHIGEIGRGVTVLEESISECAFRVVTDDEDITNSFWNFYLN